ncbi:hypothetical protein GPECTOR_139g677 [Gonium pectorale]|uniref:Uncharacterized protein n=1 Tax=Gonium pectorale TaxID=33097 RepID=A0A150FY26_GONPE|nr:hypothetical protein GPECTOR_139g677 [Gonium pectorale]|eukprot:KXZ42521.1 hypothetical protein GPECTOR_139g677 [Gonium pectorale]
MAAQQGAGEAVDAYAPSSSPGSPKKKGRSKPSSPSQLGRTDGWVVPTPSPGPGAYNPSIQPVVSAAERAVFGTAYREQEEKRFMSALHNQGMPNAETPGPGAYRTADMRLFRTDKSAKFGSAQQRPDVPKEAQGKPGAVYDLPSTLSNISVNFGTAPNSLRPTRSGRGGSPLRDPRSLQSERFPLEHMDTPGPDSYPLIPPEKLSHHEAPPRYTFGRASREQATRGQLTQQHMQADSTVSTAAATPAAIYDLPSMPRPEAVAVFSKGPAHYSPEKGGNAKGPYIGKLHADSLKGIESPGPGAYAAPGCLGTAGGAKFGPASPSRTPKPNEVEVPGPGAHNPNFAALSVRPTSSSYSMGANIRTDWTTFSPNTPGPAAYQLPAPDRTSTNTAAPAYSMGAAPGGRLGHVARNTTPAPDAYGRPEDPRDRSPVKKGFSFGLKERTKTEGVVVSNRYHGPLHAQEGMGTESPGPGCYEVPSPTGRAAPGTRFGTSGRDAGSKMYISHIHASAEGFGTASPGPGCYNVADTGGVGSASRFAAKVAPKFGTSQRFSDKVCTK